MAAGHDTSANVLSWCVYLMATKPEVQNKLRDETRELGQDSEITFERLDTLPYMNNFVKETLRVYANATTIHCQANVDETICGTFIPKGTTFGVVPHVSLMTPLIWGDDVDDFDPGRWDLLSEAAQSPYAFSTFSNSPRICLGRLFAMREIKIILVEMVRNYRFLEVDGPFTVENPSLTLRP
ncbi:cytochrome P450 [Pseudomassariella vexata]|uniref:Cytochrome P450 n=1 Tax=Pseudomassariella vexata TaxID=1141098 RepID=A0A1Y2E9W9_9PEZI|nr:cytochrome P450 [Pseudomassariella vexata]ORY68349.1 cytochrome P450 [Pseudomassariella vexata]